MPKSQYKGIKGKDLAKILINEFGFKKISQKGSHLKLKFENKITIIPLHNQNLPYGTFKNVLFIGGLTEKIFYETK